MPSLTQPLQRTVLGTRVEVTASAVPDPAASVVSGTQAVCVTQVSLFL